MDAGFDLRDDATLRNPFPAYERLRSTQPVWWDPRLRLWILTRFDDVSYVINHPASFSVERFTSDAHADGRPGRIDDLAGLLGHWAVYRDPPDHTRLRTLLAVSFTPRRVAELEPRILAIIADMLDHARERGQFDFVSEFAFPLPARVICHMLGVPEADLANVKSWSKQIADYIGGSLSGDDIEHAKHGLKAAIGYFQDLVRERSKRPGADVLSLLLAARDSGQRLSEEEVAANCVLLLFAGHETTANLLASAMAHLLSAPAIRGALTAEPELVPAAVEEFLRLHPPVTGTLRIATEDVELGGQLIRCRQPVAAMIAAANRDPARFTEPDRFDPGRSPNRHLSFGYGTHFCLGAPLARLEATLAIREILRRLPDAELAEDPVWKAQLFFRGPERLEVSIDPLRRRDVRSAVALGRAR